MKESKIFKTYLDENPNIKFEIVGIGEDLLGEYTIIKTYNMSFQKYWKDALEIYV